MIISASRRTDIPAFYSDWFINRLYNGYTLVRNPMNHSQVSRISLSPDVVDCIVFWTKNPTPMIDKLDKLKEYGYNNKYYFQFTLNSYGVDIEQTLPPKNRVLIDSFKRLSDKIGSDRVIWRYDPIMISDRYTVDYHTEYFSRIAERLNGYTRKCIFSFYDDYKTVQKSVKQAGAREPSVSKMNILAKSMSDTAKSNKLALETCAEQIDLSAYGINHARCVDDRLIERIIGYPLDVDKDKNQRLECGCVQSIDIGKYNTCLNGCIYCYANHSKALLEKLKYDSDLPLLCDSLLDTDIVKDREMKSLLKRQIEF